MGLGEFELIERFFTRPARRAVLGVGDDCAVLAPTPGMQLCVSTDMLVEGRHFLSTVAPQRLGHKALAVNLSDLAACGAEPLACTLALALPRADEVFLQGFAEGLWTLAERHGMILEHEKKVVEHKPPPVQVVVVTPTPPPKAPPPKRVPRLRELLEPEIRARLVELEESPDRVTVIVLGDTLFRSASAKLEPGYVDLFRRIGEALDEVSGKILVTGHTDNVPIRSLRFPSNWHLSQERALSVMQVVAERVKAKGRLEAEGRADTEPRVPNDTQANRARNRRVEVVLVMPAGEP